MEKKLEEDFWFTLPADIWTSILCLMNLGDLSLLRLSCKTFYKLITVDDNNEKGNENGNGKEEKFQNPIVLLNKPIKPIEIDYPPQVIETFGKMSLQCSKGSYNLFYSRETRELLLFKSHICISKTNTEIGYYITNQKKLVSHIPGYLFCLLRKEKKEDNNLIYAIPFEKDLKVLYYKFKSEGLINRIIIRKTFFYLISISRIGENNILYRFSFQDFSSKIEESIPHFVLITDKNINKDSDLIPVTHLSDPYSWYLSPESLLVVLDTKSVFYLLFYCEENLSKDNQSNININNNNNNNNNIGQKRKYFKNEKMQNNLNGDIRNDKNARRFEDANFSLETSDCNALFIKEEEFQDKNTILLHRSGEDFILCKEKIYRCSTKEWNFLEFETADSNINKSQNDKANEMNDGETNEKEKEENIIFTNQLEMDQFDAFINILGNLIIFHTNSCYCFEFLHLNEKGRNFRARLVWKQDIPKEKCPVTNPLLRSDSQEFLYIEHRKMLCGIKKIMICQPKDLEITMTIKGKIPGTTSEIPVFIPSSPSFVLSKNHYNKSFYYFFDFSILSRVHIDPKFLLENDPLHLLEKLKKCLLLFSSHNRISFIM